MKEVGNILNVTPRTVAFHKYRMMEEFHIKTNAELIQFAINQRLITSSPLMPPVTSASSQRTAVVVKVLWNLRPIVGQRGIHGAGFEY